MNLENCFKNIHNIGATSIEILANSHIDSYPELSDDFWRTTDVATLKVYQKGGLEQSFHDVSVHFAASGSYMPLFQDKFNKNGDDTSFNEGTYTREKMIIV